MIDSLDRLLRAAIAEGPYLNGAVCLIDPDGWEVPLVHGILAPESEGKADPLTDPGLRMRMASISKAVTARIACELAARGDLDLDTKVSDVLDAGEGGARVEGITVKHLLNHTSGLTDHAGYIFEPPTSPLEYLVAHANRAVSGHPPGGWFKYANLNYVLLGSLLEAVTGDRFDHLARDLVLGPAGIQGGFNWAGVSPKRRDRRLQIYQRFGDRLECQTEPDGADWNADIVWGDGRGISFADYVPVRDTLLFSPHAGLRMNVIEAARLGRFLGADTPGGRLQREATWKFNPLAPNGTDCDGLYGEFGLGVMAYRDTPRIAGPLVGHAGHALGFTGGVWFNESTGRALAIALTGSADLTDGCDDEVFYAAPELALMKSI
ncbi:CubicO group peptidase (beta-lactamase class C family) [Aliiruegeria haliotis]|uniref:CubicO group peptidase (Beta-lactamase class C family) n=1 Tax=Aliiruegeria haliotis TaxID=1280846 RepID=A0A2T0RSP0_9RHOB|nr:serine hydrolase domain-containing protein [Aliiruegeria haliotis]PRY24194.1 CubicO group peptidase (beta-lactamase class C family) [Aliiruegeria haliotis]